jgi:prophage regulatory protein
MRLNTTEDSLEPLRHVIAVTGLTRSTIYRKIEDGSFPRPAKLGYSSRWSRREIQEWIKARLQERPAVAA